MLRSDFGPVHGLRPGRRPHDGRAMCLAENAILSNGVFWRANREIGVPGDVLEGGHWAACYQTNGLFLDSTRRSVQMGNDGNARGQAWEERRARRGGF